MVKESASIKRNLDVRPSLDYDLIRKEAIATSQKASGKKWTDYNLHDPGVTIIEQFSYALTDIAYRTNIDVKELLFHDGIQAKQEQLGYYNPADVFTPPVVTQIDYRVLFLDQFHHVLTNCWFEPIKDHREGIKGLYDLVLHLKADVPASQYPKLKKEFRRFFLKHRNLCEDLEEILILQPRRLEVQANIEVNQEFEAEEVLAQLLFEVEQYLNPWIEFKSLQDLKAQGLSYDQIYNLASHEHGFIDPEQLREMPNEFYVSTIEELISMLPGVRYVEDVVALINGTPVDGDSIYLEQGTYLTVIPSQEEIDADFELDISVTKGEIPNQFDTTSVFYLFEQLNYRQRRDYSFRSTKEELPRAKASDDLGEYDSIQYTFPSIYAVGEYSPSKEEGKKRLAQSSQLKGFLSFFDQILSNHLAQLLNLHKIIQTHDFDADELRTYFSRSLKDSMPDAGLLLKFPLRTLSDLDKAIYRAKRYAASDAKRSESEVRLLNEERERRLKWIQLEAEKHFNRLLALTDNNLLKDQTFQDRDIYTLLAELNRQIKAASDSKAEELKIEKNKRSVLDKISKELEEFPAFVEMTEEDLDRIIASSDTPRERKNRMLSHMLARFGERFSTDFNLKFLHVDERVGNDHLADLIRLKSAFLKDVVNIGRGRFLGVDLSGPDAIYRPCTLQQKVALLMDMKQDAVPNSLSERVEIERMTSGDVQRVKSKTSTFEYISTDTIASKSQVEFVINSPQFMKYLFRFGLEIKNFQIIKETSRYYLYFTPPTNEEPTRLYDASSKLDARKFLNRLIEKLKEISAQHEGFHIVENILFRPSSGLYGRFYLVNKSGERLFVSEDVRKEAIQRQIAFDTAVLATFKGNYYKEQRENGDYVVTIKGVNKQTYATSSESFLTELKADQFIEACHKSFEKQKQDLRSSFELEGDLRYFYELLDDEGSIQFRGKRMFELSELEEEIQKLQTSLLTEETYDIQEERRGVFRVALVPYGKEVHAFAQQSFSDSTGAKRFIKSCIKRFSKWTNRSSEKFVRIQREGGYGSDAYNHTLSVIYPDWTARFNNAEFLELFMHTVRRNIPAHLRVSFIGLDYSKMNSFQNAYSSALNVLSDTSIENRSEHSDEFRSVLKYLIDEQQ